MTYKIIGDSCCDYTDYSDNLKWLTRVPLTITLDGIEYVDDDKLDCMALLDRIAASKEAPKSACPAPGQFLAAYMGEATDIYVVTLSEKVSGTYASAVMAAEMAKDNELKKNIHVFNSRSAAAGEIAVCVKIKELADGGADFAEVVSQTEAYIEQMNTLFTLETLEVLRKNGRLTKVQAIVTEALQLKMVMGANEEGDIKLVGKALTMNAAIKKMIDQTVRLCEGRDVSDRNFYITQCNCPERAAAIGEQVLKKCAFKGVVICEARGISTIYANSGGIITAF